MYIFSEGISHAENILFAQSQNSNRDDYEYHLKKITCQDMSIQNKSVALGIDFSNEESEQKVNLYKQVDEYNQYLNELESIPDFIDVFVRNNLCLSKETAVNTWSDNIVAIIFSRPKTIFPTDINIVDDYILDSTVVANYEVTVEDEPIALSIGETSDSYADKISGNIAIWNWTDNGHDFCYFLWKLLGARNRKNEEAAEDDEVTYFFDDYDQIRSEYVEPQLVRIFMKMESLGYIKTYTIKSEQYDPRWKNFCKSDGSMDLAIISKSFRKNKLLMEQIELILWSNENKLRESPYFLTGNDGSQKLSSVPGKFGGHNGLKIYGRLTCPSAKRYIEKGQYVQSRVFFEDEETAKKAGYRPCGVCMKEAYQKWKEEKV